MASACIARPIDRRRKHSSEMARFVHTCATWSGQTPTAAALSWVAGAAQPLQKSIIRRQQRAKNIMPSWTTARAHGSDAKFWRAPTPADGRLERHEGRTDGPRRFPVTCCPGRARRLDGPSHQIHCPISRIARPHRSARYNARKKRRPLCAILGSPVNSASERPTCIYKSTSNSKV